MSVVALVVAAGRGVRAGDRVPKQYRVLGGSSVLARAIDHLAHPAIDAIQVVIGDAQHIFYLEAIGDRRLPPPILGGATRQDSVRNGLETLADSGFDRVLIHDAARPFVPAEVVDRLLGALDAAPGSVPILPVVDTLARSSGLLGDTVQRADLVRVQTPQAFHFDAILAAHRWRG